MLGIGIPNPDGDSACVCVYMERELLQFTSLGLASPFCVLPLRAAEAMKKLPELDNGDLQGFIKYGKRLGLKFTFMGDKEEGIPNSDCAYYDRLSPQQRERMMRKFERGSTHLLVSASLWCHGSAFGHSFDNLIAVKKTALAAERERLGRCNELLQTGSPKSPPLDIGNEELVRDTIWTSIQRVSWNRGRNLEVIKTTADELVRILNNPPCPRFIRNLIFAETIFTFSRMKATSLHYSYAHLIVLVSSRVPNLMDMVLARLNARCIYTVPKHIEHLDSAFESREEYYRALGYQEEGDGELESSDHYLARLASYVGLYGALVQTDASGGIKNLYGPEHGRIWLVRFLQGLPANLYTAVALEAFLRVAGFGLYRSYQYDFILWLQIVSEDFLPKLKTGQDSKLEEVYLRIQRYIEDGECLKEPDGWIK